MPLLPGTLTDCFFCPASSSCCHSSCGPQLPIFTGGLASVIARRATPVTSTAFLSLQRDPTLVSANDQHVPSCLKFQRSVSCQARRLSCVKTAPSTATQPYALALSQRWLSGYSDSVPRDTTFYASLRLRNGTANLRLQVRVLFILTKPLSTSQANLLSGVEGSQIAFAFALNRSALRKRLVQHTALRNTHSASL